MAQHCFGIYRKMFRISEKTFKCLVYFFIVQIGIFGQSLLNDTVTIYLWSELMIETKFYYD